jgi:hypothetical protein
MRRGSQRSQAAPHDCNDTSTVIGAASAKHGDAPTANLDKQGIEHHIFLSPRLLLSTIKPN